jgi:hypothetical protein
MTSLTREQRICLHNALMAAFPSWDDVALMVALQLDTNLETVSARGRRLQNVILDLITWAEAKGYLAELTAGALAAQPKNPELVQFAAMMQAHSQPPAAATASDTRPANFEYELLVWKAVQFAGTEEFRATMARREAAVCRLEVSDHVGIATGALLGPDLVVTNYHVVAPYAHLSQPAAPNMICRFDYKSTAAGTQTADGRVVRLSSEADWCFGWNEALDYAIVRLADKPGHDRVRVGDAIVEREWLTPTAHEFASGESVFILQHPQGAPLKVAAGGVTQVESARVRYLANTLPGSSGSPVCTSDWRLAALHRGGDSISNAGTTYAAILAHLKETGRLLPSPVSRTLPVSG